MEVLYRVEEGNFSEVTLIIERQIEADPKPADETTIVAFNYLLAIMELYRGNLSKVNSIILNARRYYKKTQPFISLVSYRKYPFRVSN